MFSLGSFIVAGFVADIGMIQASKMVHNKITKKETKEKILNEGLYHFTSDANIDKILESKELRTSKGFLINNFGKDKAYMFAGVPTFDVFAKNIKDELDPMIHQISEVSAVKINIQEEQLDKFKTRELNDGAIVHEGNVNLDDKEIEKVVFVLDLDKEGNYYFREKTIDEIENGYEQSGELQEKLQKNRGNIVKAGFRSLKIEHQETRKNAGTFLKEKIDQLKQFVKNKMNNVKALPHGEKIVQDGDITLKESGIIDSKRADFRDRIKVTDSPEQINIKDESSRNVQETEHEQEECR